jgi:hypothetical protein
MHDRVVNHPVPPREINLEISPELQEIVCRALERDAKNRYPSAREFAQESITSRAGTGGRAAGNEGNGREDKPATQENTLLRSDGIDPGLAIWNAAVCR